MDKSIDINAIGKFGYNFLRQSKLIPDKDKSKLTLIERENLIKMLLKFSTDLLNKVQDTSKIEDKFVFLFTIYPLIIAYLNNTDLNKYIKITPKINNEK